MRVHCIRDPLYLRAKTLEIKFFWKKKTKAKFNKPRTAKVGAIFKAQNYKSGDSLGFVKLQLVAKYEKN